MIGAWPALLSLPRAFWAAGFAATVGALFAGAPFEGPVGEELTELDRKADAIRGQNHIIKRVNLGYFIC
jgi:hypothetical protein